MYAKLNNGVVETILTQSVNSAKIIQMCRFLKTFCRNLRCV
jgi:hypothetical protein